MLQRLQDWAPSAAKVVGLGTVCCHGCGIERGCGIRHCLLPWLWDGVPSAAMPLWNWVGSAYHLLPWLWDWVSFAAMAVGLGVICCHGCGIGSHLLPWLWNWVLFAAMAVGLGTVCCHGCGIGCHLLPWLRDWVLFAAMAVGLGTVCCHQEPSKRDFKLEVECRLMLWAQVCANCKLIPMPFRSILCPPPFQVFKSPSVPCVLCFLLVGFRPGRIGRFESPSPP